MKDYSHMSIYDIVKMVLEDYTGLPVESNIHVQTTMMWRMAELVEDGEVEVFDGTVIEYFGEEDPEREGLVEIGFVLVDMYSDYLTFTGKANTDENKFETVKTNKVKINKGNGENN